MSWSDFVRGGGSLGAAYYKKEKKQYQDAFNQFGLPTPQEQELMRQQVAAVQQAADDRRATRDLILAQMGFKIGTDTGGKRTLVPLSTEERRAMMSKTDQSKSDAIAAYQERANAAASGTTKLPSFLKKDIDHQKVKEEALLGELLGTDALNSTAGKQAVEALRKKEEELRQKIQDQDLAVAPGSAMNLSGQMATDRNRQIGSLEALPRQNEALVAGRGSLINQLQNYRLDALKKRYGQLENKRSMIQSFYTLGGTVGGAAASYANNRKTQPETTTPEYSSYGPYAGDYRFDNSTSSPGAYESATGENPWYMSGNY